MSKPNHSLGAPHALEGKCELRGQEKVTYQPWLWLMSQSFQGTLEQVW